jgi:hypothetical protein
MAYSPSPCSGGRKYGFYKNSCCTITKRGLNKPLSPRDFQKAVTIGNIGKRKEKDSCYYS